MSWNVRWTNALPPIEFASLAEHEFSSYKVMQSDGTSYCGDVVLNSVYVAHKNKVSILDQNYKHKIFLSRILIQSIDSLLMQSKTTSPKNCSYLFASHCIVSALIARKLRGALRNMWYFDIADKTYTFSNLYKAFFRYDIRGKKVNFIKSLHKATNLLDSTKEIEKTSLISWINIKFLNFILAV